MNSNKTGTATTPPVTANGEVNIVTDDNFIAEELHFPQVANMVALEALSAATGAVALSTLERVLEAHLKHAQHAQHAHKASIRLLSLSRLLQHSLLVGAQ